MSLSNTKLWFSRGNLPKKLASKPRSLGFRPLAFVHTPRFAMPRNSQEAVTLEWDMKRREAAGGVEGGEALQELLKAADGRSGENAGVVDLMLR